MNFKNLHGIKKITNFKNAQILINLEIIKSKKRKNKENQKIKKTGKKDLWNISFEKLLKTS